MTYTDACTIVGILQGQWPNHPWTEHSPEAYLRGLGDLDFAKVDAAVTTLIQTATFAPVPSEIRRTVIGDCGIPTPAEAWEEVQGNVTDDPKYSDQPWSHPMIQRTVKAIGGIYNLRNSERPNADRRDFMAMYTEFRDKALRETLLDPDGPKAIRIVAGSDVLGLPA